MALSQPDEALLRRAQLGDEHAFSLLMRQYELPVFNYVLRSLGNHHLAEDLTQEIFLRAFRNLPHFSFRSKFTTWLFAIAKNRVLDEVRASARRPSVVDLDDVPPPPAPGMPFERRATLEALWDAVQSLDVELKMPLLLRDVVGLSYREIADSLGISLATVKWRIYTAREKVKLALEREEAIA
jgi:RNA polymerase sigma-70 factor (ECF subfamily)